MFLVQSKRDSNKTSHTLLSVLQSYSHQQTILKTNSTFISLDDIISAPDGGYHRNHQQISRFACFSRIEQNVMNMHNFLNHIFCVTLQKQRLVLFLEFKLIIIEYLIMLGLNILIPNKIKHDVHHVH